MPGTTVDQNTDVSPNQLNPNDRVGGASIDGLYGVSGMLHLGHRDGSRLLKKALF